MQSENTRLPVDIIQEIILCAIQEDKTAAMATTTTCKTIYSWIIPVLYSTVVLKTSRQVFAFERTLCGLSRDASLPTPAAESNRTLGSYVRHLWLGPTLSKCCIIPPEGAANALEDIHDLENPQILADAWCSAMEVLAQCTSLHTLAIVDYPGLIVRMLFWYLPSTLDSLYILLHDNPATYQLKLLPEDASPLASIRSIVFVHTSLTVSTMRLLSQTTSITRICTLPPRGSATSLPSWEHIRNVTTHLRLLAEAESDLNMIPAMFIFLENRDLTLRMSAVYHVHVLAPYPQAQLNRQGIAISVVDGRDESGNMDTVKTLYDLWVMTLGPSLVGCVQLTELHPYWSMPMQSSS